MIETRTITTPGTMPLIDRILYVSRQILEWLRSVDESFNFEKDQLKLKEIEHDERGYAYHYEVFINEDLSVSDVNKT